jgi:hypothetical protein
MVDILSSQIQDLQGNGILAGYEGGEVRVSGRRQRGRAGEGNGLPRWLFTTGAHIKACSLVRVLILPVETKDRRKIEAEAFSGNLLGLIATNALELGVDIGTLDAVITLGFPYSIASFVGFSSDLFADVSSYYL